VSGASVPDGDERRSGVRGETDGADAPETLGADLADSRVQALSALEERPGDQPGVEQLTTLLEAVAVTADGAEVLTDGN